MKTNASTRGDTQPQQFCDMSGRVFFFPAGFVADQLVRDKQQQQPYNMPGDTAYGIRVTIDNKFDLTEARLSSSFCSHPGLRHVRPPLYGRPCLVRTGIYFERYFSFGICSDRLPNPSWPRRLLHHDIFPLTKSARTSTGIVLLLELADCSLLHLSLYNPLSRRPEVSTSVNVMPSVQPRNDRCNRFAWGSVV